MLKVGKKQVPSTRPLSPRNPTLTSQGPPRKKTVGIRPSLRVGEREKDYGRALRPLSQLRDRATKREKKREKTWELWAQYGTPNGAEG